MLLSTEFRFISCFSDLLLLIKSLELLKEFRVNFLQTWWWWVIPVTFLFDIHISVCKLALFIRSNWPADVRNSPQWVFVVMFYRLYWPLSIVYFHAAFFNQLGFLGQVILIGFRSYSLLLTWNYLRCLSLWSHIDRLVFVDFWGFNKLPECVEDVLWVKVLEISLSLHLLTKTFHT